MKFFLSSLLLLSFGSAAHGACETAFAYCAPAPTNTKVTSAQCFDKTSPSFSRWGWVHKQTVTPPTIACTLYAGAAGCDFTKGAVAGTATISKTSFQINLNSAWEYAPGPLNATDEGSTVVHFYHGLNMYPTTGGNSNGVSTVAPGKYDAGYATNQAGFYTILNGGLKANEYFILHASVCSAVSPFVSLVLSTQSFFTI